MPMSSRPGDLALQEAARRLFDLPARPTERELRAMAEALVARSARLPPARFGPTTGCETRPGGRAVTRGLEFGRGEAASGEADSLVIFLHGYGADGNDLLGLADPLAPHLPDTVFVAPDAPERCGDEPDGLPVVPDPLDRRIVRGGRPRQGMARAVDDLNAFLDRVMVEEDMIAGQVGPGGLQPGHDDGAARRPAPGRGRCRAWSAFRAG